MAIRMSGMISGLDTEAIVGALMSAQSLKKTKVSNAKTKLEWKQTKWQDMNKKLYSLYTGAVSKMRLQSSYMTKKATVSDSSIANISANSGAVNGSYTMQVENIATSQYLTGGKVEEITNTNQKLSSVSSDLVGSTITVKSGDKDPVSFTIGEDTTVAQFTKALSDAGLNANFDTAQQRFFISSKDTGLDNSFSITSTNVSSDITIAADSLKEAIGYSSLDDEKKEKADGYIAKLQTETMGSDEYNAAVDGLKNLTDDTLDNATEIEEKITDYVNASSGVAVSALSKLGLGNVTVNSEGLTVDGTDVKAGESESFGSNAMAVVAASDSKIILNGAELTSSSSTVSVNGLSINLTGKTEAGKSVTFSVSNDVDAVYDSIKSALKEYNSVLSEMYKAYTADSAREYSPLTSEQKEAMSDDEVKEWEDKIKSSLLRSDSTLDGIMQSMKSAMSMQVSYNGQNYTLGSFGIFMSSDYSEGGQYHIYGDSEDTIYADRTDRLKKALEEDADTVMNVMSAIFEKLRSNMNDRMSASSVSSAMTFYNDISMTSELKNYKTEISEWDTRLAAMEDKYYSQFTAMEKALAKLQTQQSSLGSIMGG